MKKTILIVILAVSVPVFAQQNYGSRTTGPVSALPLADGLGGIDHPVTTKSADAQKLFNQGLAYLYAFNHAEGVRSFRQAAQLDPEMAMAYWGISLGLGSNYNVSADETQLTEAYENLQKALALAPKASQADRDYIAALAKRYARDPKTDQIKLAVEYKNAMGELSRKYPDDLDAATLYAESMMNLKPWQLWSLDGKPAEGTLDIIAVLESVLKRNPKHSGANHYYIHAVEASPNPERALASANRLGLVAPSAGHLVHMPSHIYLRTGDWKEAAKSNDLAIQADRKYIEATKATGIYPLMYFNHNIHMLAASHIGGGNFAGALKAARELETNVGPHVKAMPPLEMFMPYTIVTYVRFHRWDDIAKYPQPAAELKFTNAYWRLGRGLAAVEGGRLAEAEKELASLREVTGSIPANAVLGNSPAHNVMKALDALLEGEIQLAKGDRTNGVATLRKAVAAEDVVNYNEPPDLDLPMREWLGRALMRAGKFAEAENIYREEITRHPRNGRALFGLAEALKKQGKTESAALVSREFADVWAEADTKMTVEALYGKTKPAGSVAGAGAKRPRVRLATGITMSYVESGPADGPVVVLLHGITDSSYSYSRVLPMIDKRFRVYALDQRGHGDSDKPETGYRMKDLAADVAAFMDAKNVRSATVVGHSMGSFVAMQTALDFPDRIERLVLVGTATTANSGAAAELVPVFKDLKDPIPVEFVRDFQVGASSPTLPAEFLDRIVADSLKVPAHVWREAFAGVVSRDYGPELGRIKVPVTIFWGEKETIFFRNEQEKLVSALPRAELKTYPDAGHAPHWEQPERFARDLNAVLTKAAGGGVD